MLESDTTSSCEHCLTRRSYDVLLDKGMYDAICMNPADTHVQRSKYHHVVSQLVRHHGLFVITSCNWTRDELLQQFSSGNCSS